MAEWYIQRKSIESEDIGPLRPNELLKMVRDGDVIADTLVRKDDSAWFPASSVGGLFEAAMRPTIEYFCPQCERAIGEPPILCPNCGREVRKALTKITENSIARSPNNGGANKSVQQWLRNKLKRKDNE